MTDTQARDLRALPKAHLHVHLEGAMRPQTLTDLADRHGLPANLQGDGSFASFIALYRAACEALRSPDDLSRLVHEIVEDAAADGTIWIEISAWVSSDHAKRVGVRDQAEVLEVLLEAGHRAQRASGVGVGFIVSANRTKSPAEAIELARLATKHRDDGVVGLGLADDETKGDASLFTEAFAVARDAGLIRAPHAGEHGGPDSVRHALDSLDAQRVMHGVRCVEDAEVVRRLADENVTLDVCPTSNVVLRVVPSLAEHPLPRLLEAGVPLSLNADDPLFFGSNILAEYELGRHSFGLDDPTLAHIARCSIHASGAPQAVKSAALVGIDRWLTS